MQDVQVTINDAENQHIEISVKKTFETGKDHPKHEG